MYISAPDLDSKTEVDHMDAHPIRMSPTRRTGAWEKRAALVVLITAGLAFGCVLSAAQEKPDDNAVWTSFISWFKSAPLGGDPFTAYADKLGKEGVPETEVQRRLAVVARLFAKRPEGVEAFYDRAFSRPLTGDPSKDGFNSAPSDFVVDGAKGLKPGSVLDLGTGQGRNAVHLAREGWDVTGLDISQVALDRARENAAKAGVSIQTVKAAYDMYDFGVEKWDMIVMDFAWAPVSEPEFVAKVEKSLRPGGIVLFEHFIDNPKSPYPSMVRALNSQELKDYFSGFEILSYDEKQGTADWGGPGSRIVRMIARKIVRKAGAPSPH
jgi:2-polyprenyl-3-methyl-5-hydroxy-6-metoxy-1,4-benzoquinol methylase